jgi:NADH-quinone oxidoreductase subunit M
MNSQLLSLAIWVPILGAVPVFAAGSERRTLVRWLALAVAVAGFLVTLPLYTRFDATQAGMQFVEQAPWITRFNVQYLLGVDGISMPFILLNSFITVMVVLAGWEVIEEKQAQYMVRIHRPVSKCAAARRHLSGSAVDGDRVGPSGILSQ